CTDSAVLRILGIGDELRKAAAGQPTSYDRPEEGSDLLLGARMKGKTRNTQICPQCDWEIDAGYRVCPHCHFYLAGK
ncbi:MAG: TFIIB-type zinc finger domain-containing protein, partial [Thermoguttaceae bacterium]|nr:TFIIB-type zinc finger domain-containing protein [Thermoguttaceae bacterium]